MYDIHTHLYWSTYDLDRNEVIRRAREAGVKRMLVVGCTIEESQQCVKLADEYPELFASVGIHPQTFTEKGIVNLQSWIRELKGLAQTLKKVVAIGECGLEYFSHSSEKTITKEQKQWQREGFLAQIELARELKLPLIVHCRTDPGVDDGYRDLLEILQIQGQSLETIILHCYMGDTEVTRDFLILPNVSFSFTANITYPVKRAVIGTKDDLHETVKLIPLERMFAETDCPFLAPQSHRGKRNEPQHVIEVITKIALLRGVSVNRVKRVLGENYDRIFSHLEKKGVQ